MGVRETQIDTTLTRILCLFTLLLVACTWRLWFAVSDFPMVPWLDIPTAWASWVLHADRLAAFVLIATLSTPLTLALISSRSPATVRLWSHRALLVAVLSASWLMFTNQHRVQPWAYHFLLSGYVLLVLPSNRARNLLLALLVSVYAFSAWNKFDHRFLATTGELMVRTAVGWFRPDVAKLPAGYFARAALALPLGEALLAGGLAVPATRGAARVLAIFLHGSLLMVLGPWGLGQRVGVLVWNVSFATQACYLASQSAGRRLEPSPGMEPEAPRHGWTLLPLLVALTMPALEPWGMWDHWPSWGLYSARAGRLELLLSGEAAARLGPAMKDFLDPRVVDGAWQRLALDRWSLERLDAPLYPQTRFQWGVCQAVMKDLPQGSGPVIIVEYLAPERTTGRMERRIWGDDASIRQAIGRFWFNTRPRATAMSASSFEAYEEGQSGQSFE